MVENRRRTYLVWAPARGRFELAFDQVTYRNPISGRVYRERQVEVECLSGTGKDLEQVVGALRHPALRPASESKYERARRLTAGTAPLEE